MKVILASGSPRRKELLTLMGIEFTAVSADVDETLSEGISPDMAVEQLSRKKAEFIAKQYPNGIVIGADTVVAVEDKILGKPKDAEDAIRMLMMLSGKSHKVYTGVYIAGEQFNIGFSESTEVSFFKISEEEAEDYVKTGEPMDKAGAYAIQGIGAALVKGIVGDYNNVVGLPAAKVKRILEGLPVD